MAIPALESSPLANFQFAAIGKTPSLLSRLTEGDSDPPSNFEEDSPPSLSPSTTTTSDIPAATLGRLAALLPSHGDRTSQTSPNSNTQASESPTGSNMQPSSSIVPASVSRLDFLKVDSEELASLLRKASNSTLSATPALPSTTPTSFYFRGLPTAAPAAGSSTVSISTSAVVPESNKPATPSQTIQATPSHTRSKTPICAPLKPPGQQTPPPSSTPFVTFASSETLRLSEDLKEARTELDEVRRMRERVVDEYKEFRHRSQETLHAVEREKVQMERLVTATEEWFGKAEKMLERREQKLSEDHAFYAKRTQEEQERENERAAAEERSRLAAEEARRLEDEAQAKAEAERAEIEAKAKAEAERIALANAEKARAEAVEQERLRLLEKARAEDAERERLRLLEKARTEDAERERLGLLEKAKAEDAERERLRLLENTRAEDAERERQRLAEESRIQAESRIKAETEARARADAEKRDLLAKALTSQEQQVAGTVSQGSPHISHPPQQPTSKGPTAQATTKVHPITKETSMSTGSSVAAESSSLDTSTPTRIKGELESQPQPMLPSSVHVPLSLGAPSIEVRAISPHTSAVSGPPVLSVSRSKSATLLSQQLPTLPINVASPRTVHPAQAAPLDVNKEEQLRAELLRKKAKTPPEPARAGSSSAAATPPSHASIPSTSATGSGSSVQGTNPQPTHRQASSVRTSQQQTPVPPASKATSTPIAPSAKAAKKKGSGPSLMIKPEPSSPPLPPPVQLLQPGVASAPAPIAVASKPSPAAGTSKASTVVTPPAAVTSKVSNAVKSSTAAVIPKPPTAVIASKPPTAISICPLPQKPAVAPPPPAKARPNKAANPPQKQVPSAAGGQSDVQSRSSASATSQGRRAPQTSVHGAHLSPAQVTPASLSQSRGPSHYTARNDPVPVRTAHTFDNHSLPLYEDEPWDVGVRETFVPRDEQSEMPLEERPRRHYSPSPVRRSSYDGRSDRYSPRSNSLSPVSSPYTSPRKRYREDDYTRDVHSPPYQRRRYSDSSYNDSPRASQASVSDIDRWRDWHRETTPQRSPYRSPSPPPPVPSRNQSSSRNPYIRNTNSRSTPSTSYDTNTSRDTHTRSTDAWSSYDYRRVESPVPRIATSYREQRPVTAQRLVTPPVPQPPPPKPPALKNRIGSAAPPPPVPRRESPPKDLLSRMSDAPAAVTRRQAGGNGKARQAQAPATTHGDTSMKRVKLNKARYPPPQRAGGSSVASEKRSLVERFS